MRLNRFLAAAGLGSRRSCEELIRTGQVTINGVLCENLATTVEPTDVVKLGNRVLHTSAPVTLILNKPPGFICTASDEHNRQTIFDLLPTNFPRLFHVGRLDRESEGLLIVTNDGELALKLTHPRYKVDKEYEVVLDHTFDFELASKLLHGITLEEGWAKAESVFKLGPNKLKVVLRQGMKRQIRLMFYALGYEVKRLTRVRIGPIEIQKMPLGSWRVLTQKEIDALLAEGAKTAAEEPVERQGRKPRPARRSPAQRGWSERHERSDRFKGPRSAAPARSAHGRPEEIPFTPRASSGTGRPSKGPRAGATARPAYGRPDEIPFTPRSSRPKGRPASKAGPRSFAKPAAKSHTKPSARPFAKFERRPAR